MEGAIRSRPSIGGYCLSLSPVSEPAVYGLAPITGSPEWEDMEKLNRLKRITELFTQNKDIYKKWATKKSNTVRLIEEVLEYNITLKIFPGTFFCLYARSHA